MLLSKVSYYLKFSLLLYLHGSGTRLLQSITLSQASLLFSIFLSLTQGHLKVMYYLSLSSLKTVYWQDYIISKHHVIWLFSVSPFWAVWCKARAQNDMNSSRSFQLISCWTPWVSYTCIFSYWRVGKSEDITTITFLLIWISTINSTPTICCTPHLVSYSFSLSHERSSPHQFGITIDFMLTCYSIRKCFKENFPHSNF